MTFSSHNVYFDYLRGPVMRPQTRRAVHEIIVARGEATMSMTYRAISSHLARRPASQQAPATPTATTAPEPQPFGCAATMMCSPWEGLYLIDDGTPPAGTGDDETGVINNDLEHFLATLMYGE